MGIIQRLQDVLGIGEYDEEEYDEEYEEGSYEPETDSARRKTAPKNVVNNVVGMPGLPSTSPEVLLMEPRSFEEIPQAVRALRDRKSVILNLSLMEPEQAQRAADYVAGGAFALDGHQERLGAQIFLFTPSFVQIKNYSAPEPLPAPAPVYVPPRPAASPWSPDTTRIMTDPISRTQDLKITPDMF